MWTILACVAFAVVAAAAPTTSTPANHLTDFLLVTTSTTDSTSSSASLPNVNVTSLFDPSHQTDFYLRLISPGYGSLPRFNLSQGSLHTEAENVFDGYQVEEYNSTTVVADQELSFNPAPHGSGNLSLKDGYLLAVGGDIEGWTVCEGDLEESVIYWKGNDSTCEKRYIQAVKDAPY